MHRYPYIFFYSVKTEFKKISMSKPYWHARNSVDYRMQANTNILKVTQDFTISFAFFRTIINSEFQVSRKPCAT